MKQPLIITRYNYESFFIDYLDGNLNNKQMADLELFLQQNPDLAAELQEIEAVPFTADLPQASFEAKALLKKSPIDDQMSYTDYLIVAKTEHEITANETRELNKLTAKQPQITNALAQSKQALLAPNHFVRFERKSHLKKQATILKTIWYSTIPLAAAVMLYVGVWNRPLRTETQLASIGNELFVKPITTNRVEEKNEISNRKQHFRFEASNHTKIKHRTNKTENKIATISGITALKTSYRSTSNTEALNKISTENVSNLTNDAQQEAYSKVSHKISFYHLVQTALLAYNKRADNGIYLEKIQIPNSDKDLLVISNQNFSFKTKVSAKKNNY